MTRKSIPAALAVSLSLTTGSAFAQTPPPGTAPAARPTTTTADGRAAYRTRDLLGSKVSIAGGTAVGVVEDIVLSDEGVVDYLVVANDGRLTSVPWQVVKYTPADRAVVVNVPVERWRTVPTYTMTTYPNYYAPTYRADVYRFYGLTPGQERRLERALDPRR